MSERQNFIRAGYAIDQRYTAQALRYIADSLDAADDRSTIFVAADQIGGGYTEDTQEAWMWAALLIADMTNVSSVDLRAQSATIERGYRDAGRH